LGGKENTIGTLAKVIVMFRSGSKPKETNATLDQI
jgi:hypothetical protein